MSSTGDQVLQQQRYDALRQVTQRLRELTVELGPLATPERAELRHQRARLYAELGHLDLAALEYARCVLDDPDNQVYLRARRELRAQLEAGS